jgi:hypothetical protein
MSTPQANAITSAQNLVALNSQAIQLYNNATAYLADYNQNNWANYWQNMATVVINSDGSVASTNDSTPNTAHPINVPTGSPLLLSEGSLVNAKVFIAQFVTFMTQSSGTITMPAQNNLTSAAVVAPNTL